MYREETQSTNARMRNTEAANRVRGVQTGGRQLHKSLKDGETLANNPPNSFSNAT